MIHRYTLTTVWAATALLLVACGESGADRIPIPGTDGLMKTAATVRAQRRAFDGAPPTIPHDPIGACTQCHDQDGVAIPDLGYAPPLPHVFTQGLSALSHCQQCHVYATTDETFRANAFEGLQQDLRKGVRSHELAPPVMPHSVFMRENCSGCHTGPAAREEVRCTHPERANCRQCHVPATTNDVFRRT